MRSRRLDRWVSADPIPPTRDGLEPINLADSLRERMGVAHMQAPKWIPCLADRWTKESF